MSKYPRNFFVAPTGDPGSSAIDPDNRWRERHFIEDQDEVPGISPILEGAANGNNFQEMGSGSDFQDGDFSDSEGWDDAAMEVVLANWKPSYTPVATSPTAVEKIRIDYGILFRDMTFEQVHEFVGDKIWEDDDLFDAYLAAWTLSRLPVEVLTSSVDLRKFASMENFGAANSPAILRADFLDELNSGSDLLDGHWPRNGDWDDESIDATLATIKPSEVLPSAVELMTIATLVNFDLHSLPAILRTDSPDEVDTGLEIRIDIYSECDEASNISVQLMSDQASQTSTGIFAVLYILSGMLTSLWKLEGIGQQLSTRYSSRRYRELALVIWYLPLYQLSGAWRFLPRANVYLLLAVLCSLLVMLLPDNWKLEGIGQTKQSSQLYLRFPAASIFQDLQSLRMGYSIDVHHRE